MVNGLIDFFHRTIFAGMPLLFAILGEITTEKSGKLNLGVEGMMLMGAVIGFIFGLQFNSPIIAIIAAAVAGATGALIYAFLTITLRTNQIVTGLALTIFGTGFSGFLGKQLMGKVMSDEFKAFFKDAEVITRSSDPIIATILAPFEIVLNQNIFVYLGYFSVIVLGVYFYRTRPGLTLCAIGENTQAADAAGVHISLWRYVHVLVGGAFCGLAGAFLSVVYIPSWQENVTSGRGWIAIALVIFARWNPYWAIAASTIFGGLFILDLRLQGVPGLNISQYFLQVLPYLSTTIIIIIASIKQRREGSAPAMLGQPYFREDR
ncbi:MAG: ABC transporter permease [Lentisphaeria bacterium]